MTTVSNDNENEDDFAVVNKTEKLRLSLTFNREQMGEHYDDVKLVYDRSDDSNGGTINPIPRMEDFPPKFDRFTLKYTLCCVYFGSVANTLTTINRLLAANPDCLDDASYEELTDGRMLLHTVLTQLDGIMEEADRSRLHNEVKEDREAK